MNELQKRVDRLISELGGYWSPFEMLAALAEELGEVSRELLKLEGVKGEGNLEKLEEEIGDLIFATACIANYYEIDIFRALEKSIEKYRKRDLAG
ncbi:MAG: hypothetical protein PWQ79_682 [Thermococcaceae archaeon]|nr:hypothetical protein [Thermococcaceae archaeon]MDK2913767.1 hypothetical protein [Thermococcaceae archaeon]